MISSLDTAALSQARSQSGVSDKFASNNCLANRSMKVFQLANASLLILNAYHMNFEYASQRRCLVPLQMQHFYQSNETRRNFG